MAAESGSARLAHPENPYGLRRLDHTAMPVHDPEMSAQFVEEVLGGVIHHTIGYDEEERRAPRGPNARVAGAVGRIKHMFLHVGSTLVQVGEPHDGKTFADPANPSGFPHWAFGVGADGLDAFRERLAGHGIPCFGPVQQGSCTSLYFQDPDGNKMEAVTWEPYAGDALDGAASSIDWPSLANGWRPGTVRRLERNIRPSAPRMQYPANRFGIAGIDHFGLPARDPGHSARFAAEILGGTVFEDGGYREMRTTAGATRQHTMVHVGEVLLQFGHPHDGRSFTDPMISSGWPHWAFQLPVDALDRMVVRLHVIGLPFYGPTRHGPSASVYFQDPDGNKLELAIGDRYPAERTLNPTGPQELDGRMDWPSLRHAWTPRLQEAS